MTLKDKVGSLVDIYSLALTFSSHKNYCDRVSIHSSMKCTCEYDEKRRSLRDIPYIISEIEKDCFFNASNIGFMKEIETGKVFLIDRSDYEKCIELSDFKRIKRIDVTNSVKMMVEEWFLKKDND